MGTRLKPELPKTRKRSVSQRATSQSYDTLATPLWEVARDLTSNIPDADLARIPTDASANLNYYLYGAPLTEE